MKIDQYISELLYDHDCVIVTDLGGFIANYKPASINPALHVVSPPSKKLAFNASLKNNDGLLANHISQRTLLNYTDACDVIREYVKEATGGMREGQKLKIDKVGVLYLDQEERLQFLPDHHANYLIDSFGMSPVHAPVIKRTVPEPAVETPVRVRSIQPLSPEQTGKPRIIKWKILEMIPAAAVLAILIMTPPVLKEFNSNLSTLLPFSRMNEYLETIKGERPEKTQVAIPYSNPFEIPPAHKTPPNLENNSNTTQEPLPVTPSVPDKIAGPEAEVEESITVPAVTTEVVTAEPVATIEAGERSYFIIGGCFRSLENAEKFVSDLKAKGVDAAIIGQNRAGLHMVSLYSSNSYSQVNDVLPEIKSNTMESAWVYKK